ncbi:MAG: hypothetical protein QHH26_04380 [Armatimonadota bacterium]|nr:hypothetical protein [Armatimonadota bacterium]
MKPRTNLNGIVMDYYRNAVRSAWQSRIESLTAVTASNAELSGAIPLPFKSGYSAIPHDANVSHTILTSKQIKEADDEAMALAELERFVRDEGHAYFQLKSPLLIRLYLPRPNGDTVRALCTSGDMGCSGVRVYLPSRMDLKPGVALDLDLFVNKKNNPVAIKGVVSKIEHKCEKELVRYAIDIRFGPLNADALHKITEYVKSQA